MVTATPRVAVGGRCPVPAETEQTDGFVTTASFFFEDLCWGSIYGLDVLAVDEAGNVLDARTVVDAEPTGRGPFVIAEMPGVKVSSYDVRVTFDGVSGGLGWSRSASGR